MLSSEDPMLSSEDPMLSTLESMLRPLGAMPNPVQPRGLSPRAPTGARPLARMLLGASKLLSIGSPEGPSLRWVQWGYPQG